MMLPDAASTSSSILHPVFLRAGVGSSGTSDADEAVEAELFQHARVEHRDRAWAHSRKRRRGPRVEWEQAR